MYLSYDTPSSPFYPLSLTTLFRSDAAARLGGLERRLGVLPAAAPGGGVAAMADGDMTLQRREHLLVEDLGHQPEVFEDDDLRAVGHRDTSGFLAAVLQGVEAVVGELGDRSEERRVGNE